MSQQEPQNFRWAIEGVLAGCARPGWDASDVGEEVVAAWVAGLCAEGIAGVVCLLDAGGLACYRQVPGGLLGYCLAEGLSVESVPISDQQEPPLADDDLKQIRRAVRKLPKPVLICGGAGSEHTSAALEDLGRMLGEG